MAINEAEALERYEPLVRSIANRTIISSNVNGIEDLCQAGRMAVASAVRTYDETRGASLNTHVHRLVRQAIYEEAGQFCGPFSISDKTMKLASTASRLSASGMSDVEIGESCGRSAEAIGILRNMYNNRHTPSASYGEGATCSADLDLEDLIDSLPFSERERYVFTKRYLEDESVSSIARALGLHIQTVYSLDKSVREKVMREVRND